MSFELVTPTKQAAVIKVMGVGGGGNNAVEHMLKTNIEGVDFICANTDIQALERFTAPCQTLQLGNNVTHGLGAGADPEIGRKSALEDQDTIKNVLQGADMLFITAGMGGGTGTGAAPIVAEVAKEMSILTVAVVTKPFSWEREKRAQVAEKGIDELSKFVDSLITVPNDKLSQSLGEETLVLNAFSAANSVLLGAVQGIAEIITRPGLINVDFADVRTVMGQMGMAMMGSGKAQGEDRGQVAADAAISSPLLEDIELKNAKGILVNVTGGKDLTMKDYNRVGDAIKEIAAENAEVIVGMLIDPNISGEVRVTVVATGLGQGPEAKEQPLAPSIELVAGGISNVNYGDLESPAIERKKKKAKADSNGGKKDLDVPAFLRRQAD